MSSYLQRILKHRYNVSTCRLSYTQCRHTYGVFQYVYATFTNIVFTIRNVVIHPAYSNLCILRLRVSSLLYAMSSYILRIPIQHTFALSFLFCIFSRYLSATGRLCLQYHHRHNQLHVLMFIISEIIRLVYNVQRMTCRLTDLFFTVIVYVLSCVSSISVLIFG